MYRWKILDLARVFDRPSEGQLVSLRMTPSNPNATDKYDIGTFQKDPSTGRKLWWHGTHGVQDPLKMKKHYVIWWCAVKPFDE